MQLKKELAEVTLQRDVAQSQIKDMLQAAEDDVSSIEFVSNPLPKALFFLKTNLYTLLMLIILLLLFLD